MAAGVSRILIVAAVALTTSVAWCGDDGGRRIRLGGVSVSGGYMGGGPAWWGPAYWGPWSGMGMWRPWGPAWWDPMWYGGWAHPGYWNGFARGPAMGEVKLPKLQTEAMVYLDGAYAGPAAKLRSMWLEPGRYQLEVKDENGRSWERRIYVLSGKTLELRPALKEALSP
jgi:hypothetical protein